MGKREATAMPTLVAFDPTLSSADVNLAELAERVRAAPTKALSFCLSGSPGTGNSAYARHLAEKLEMEPLDKRYSDLISSYLGDSEKAIARGREAGATTEDWILMRREGSFPCNS
jgi:transitional endoplasmic reticulum ATPase